MLTLDLKEIWFGSFEELMHRLGFGSGWCFMGEKKI
jgi:hypothetical protein